MNKQINKSCSGFLFKSCLGSAIDKLLFKNPNGLPIEKLYLTVIKAEKPQLIKAIDKFWVLENQIYPHFSPLPDTKDFEEKRKWIEQADNYIAALKFLYFGMPYFKFLSNVLYDPKIIQMLDSFLKLAVPCYVPQPTDEFEKPYVEIYNLVFNVFQKILTPKQSETEFITPEVLGTLLKDNNVITNYITWDLSKLYGHIDDGTLENLIKFIYEISPALKEELTLSVICMAEIFEAIGSAAYENDAPTEKNVDNLVNLLFETAFAINMFMKIYPPYKDVCVNDNLFSRILHTYDSEVPILHNLMKQVYIGETHPGFDTVENAKVELLEICNHLVNYCMDMILQTQENVIQNQWIDKYLTLFSNILESKHFLIYYNRVFPIRQDIEMFISICPHIDRTKCNTIIEAVKKHEEEHEEKLKEKDSKTKNTSVETLESQVRDLHLEDEATLSETILLDSKISNLMDVFPDYGDGFFEQCLLVMNLDVQAVIMAILEDKLPPELSEIDRSLPRIPPEEEPGPSIQTAHIGKKPSEYRNFAELLNDKSHIEQQRPRYDVYGSMTEYDPMYDDDYEEDEFEFSYRVDFDDREEIYKPRKFGVKKLNEVEEDDDDEEEEEEEEKQKLPNKQVTVGNGNQQSKENGTKDQFCEDPALIRERREQRYMQQRQRKGHCSNNNGAKPKDVVGKPKGQGQEKEVLRNRDKKNENKSTRANHNRRSGAQWKRSRGMIPS